MAAPALAARLKHFLSRSGLTQSQVAAKLGVSEGAVSKWLSGTTPTLDNLEAFVALCRVDMATFYGPLKRKGAA